MFAFICLPSIYVLLKEVNVGLCPYELLTMIFGSASTLSVPPALQCIIGVGKSIDLRLQ
jgi:uncharacterized membrane protein YuzA (DUF378 family)